MVFNKKNKKHVITANKALIGKYGDRLAKIAEKNRVNLEFEAAVCGGVPIIRSLKEGLIVNKISKFMEYLMVHQIIYFLQWINITSRRGLIRRSKNGLCRS